MNIQTPQPESDGSAYNRPVHKPDLELTAVSAGTPCGEFMRRYWQPIALSRDVTTRPQKIRILGEDLILFRTRSGRLGLLTPRCTHRGASLYYGRVEEDGIRCCYHGWKFDVEGRCLDQPCELNGQGRKERVRQPWYPVEERYGIVFTYMGPPHKKPVLIRWAVLEDLKEGETIYVHAYTGIGAGADDTIKILPMNWLQNLENSMDPFHVPMLHARHSAVQYTPEAANMPEVEFEYSPTGLNYVAHRENAAGQIVKRVSSVVLPSITAVADQKLSVIGPTEYIRWRVPIDDQSHTNFHAMRVPAGVDGEKLFYSVSRPRPMGDSTEWSDMTEEQHQDFPSDFEAMFSQGPITLHSEEHLGTSDKGVVMLRRLLRQQIKIVQEGGDPIGVSFDEENAVGHVWAGNYPLLPST